MQTTIPQLNERFTAYPIEIQNGGVLITPGIHRLGIPPLPRNGFLAVHGRDNGGDWREVFRFSGLKYQSWEQIQSDLDEFEGLTDFDELGFCYVNPTGVPGEVFIAYQIAYSEGWDFSPPAH